MADDAAPKTAYKILTAEQWAVFQGAGEFTGAPVDLADGYIHLSTAEQLEETLAKHFAGQNNLVIAEIDLSGFGDALKWETSRGGALFPHIYGILPRSSVVALSVHPHIGPVPSELAKLRNVGKAALTDFAVLEIYSVAQLSRYEADDLFSELQMRTNSKQDPCVWDVFAATIHQARTGEARDWWAFTAVRKAR